MSKRPAPDDGLDPHDAKRNANLTSVGAAIRVWRNFRGGSFKEEDVRGDRFTTLGGYNIFKNTDSKPPPKPKYYYDSEEEEEAKEELRQRTQLKKDRQEAWLNSGLAWNASLGDGYTGVKVLGAGSFGIAGLWALKNTEANKTLVKHIVVKQTNSYKRNVIRMREEARIMQLFQGSGSRHIVKLYSGPFVEKAEGQANPFPPPAMMGGGYPDQRKKEDDGEAQLARIFIEYCEAGNMTSFIKLMRK
ncbi:hypothetical protein BDZ45DRAFT_740406 [Acephala macrosclerotiorum]|nr:hypothetical protein BDZ45DRAFT_740406 [Acephala macrosclerotiorum]